MLLLMPTASSALSQARLFPLATIPNLLARMPSIVVLAVPKGHELLEPFLAALTSPLVHAARSHAELILHPTLRFAGPPT